MSSTRENVQPASAGSLQALSNLARDLLAVIDGDNRLEFVNPAWGRALQRSDGELRGSRLEELVHPDDRPRVVSFLALCRASGSASATDLRLVDRTGAPRPVRWLAESAQADGRILLAGQDLSPAIAAERALKRAVRRFIRLFQNHPLPMIVWDVASERVLAVNDAAVAQYGYRRDEFLTLTIDRIAHPEDLAAQARLMAGSMSDPGRPRPSAVFRHRRKNGTELEVEVSGHGLEYADRPAWLVMAVDVSERRKLEEQLREAGKMEAIGRLAGGVAHDFNNLLTAINGFGQMLVSSLAPGDPRREDAQQIVLAGDRAAALTSQLLAFSRRQLLQPETLDVNAVVGDLAPMIQRLIGAGIELRLRLHARSPLVLADRARLEQVVVNLCVNARDAMHDGGTLTLETATTELRTPRSLGQDDVAPAGRYVELRVRDTGSGMDAETRKRVFEPFFTTKDRGRGTGLGLATAYGTVRQSGGHMRVTSAAAKGSSFRVYLPHAEPAAPVSIEGATAVPAAVPVVRRGTILLVDDEPTVLSLAERVLTDAGFEVILATDTSSAIAAASTFDRRISLVVTDLVIPGGGGAELARRVSELRPRTPVLYMSGYAEDAIVHEGIVDPSVEFLAKPFTARELLARVRTLLRGTGRGSRAAAACPARDDRPVPVPRNGE